MVFFTVEELIDHGKYTGPEICMIMVTIFIHFFYLFHLPAYILYTVLFYEGCSEKRDDVGVE